MKSSEIRLGSFILDPATGHLKDGGGKDCDLRHQTRNVLLMLAETPGEVVSKTAFFEKVWEGAHVSEDSLVQCIAEIRQAIGDETKSIVETVPVSWDREVHRPSLPPRLLRLRDRHHPLLALSI